MPVAHPEDPGSYGQRAHAALAFVMPVSGHAHTHDSVSLMTLLQHFAGLRSRGDRAPLKYKSYLDGVEAACLPLQRLEAIKDDVQHSNQDSRSSTASSETDRDSLIQESNLGVVSWRCCQNQDLAPEATERLSIQYSYAAAS